MSGELHEQLVQAAARENVSLNRYVTGALADSVTGTATQDARTVPPGEGGTPPPRPPAAPGRNPARSLRVALAANVVVVVLAVAVAVVLLVLAIQRGI
jgi:hypothetical protein